MTNFCECCRAKVEMNEIVKTFVLCSVCGELYDEIREEMKKTHDHLCVNCGNDIRTVKDITKKRLLIK